jgi:hypothetical protein
MISSRIGHELAVLAVLSVLTMCFFPGVQGPYSVTHGPATAFQAARAAARVRSAIVQGAQSSLGSWLIMPVVFLSRLTLPDAEFLSVRLPQCSTILRC